MTDQDKSKEQLVEELVRLRRRLARHEAAADESWGGGPAKPGGSIWQSLVANTPIFILVIDREGRIRFANRTDSGAPADRLLGTSLYDFCREEFRETIRAGIEGVFRTGEPGFCEGNVWRLDDQEHWYAAYLGPIYRQGERVAVSVIAINITERKVAEEKLRESEAKYRRLHRSMRDAFVRVDMDGHIEEYNQAYVNMLGYAPDQLQALRYVDVTPPQWHALEADIVATQVLPRGYSDIYQKEYRRKDGTVFPVELRTFLIADDEGRPRAMWAIVRDITDRKRAEEALRKAHDELELRVRLRTEELANANAALENQRRTLEHLFQASDHERQLIAYEIHDDLAQVLAGAIMYFEAFEHAVGIDRDEARRLYGDAMAMLRRGIAEARRLISGVRPPILDEAGVVEAVRHLVQERWDPPDLHIEFCSDVTFGRLVPIQENSIYRIIQEALTNAVKNSQSQSIRVELAQEGARLRIRVQDWGVGFHIDRQSEGRFGLAGIRERARLLGGSAVIESNPGRGTTILVEMPLVESLG